MIYMLVHVLSCGYINEYLGYDYYLKQGQSTPCINSPFFEHFITSLCSANLCCNVINCCRYVGPSCTASKICDLNG